MGVEQGSAWDGMGRKKSSHGIKFSEVSHGMGLLLKNFRPMGWDDFQKCCVPTHPMELHTSQNIFKKKQIPPTFIGSTNTIKCFITSCRIS